MSSESYIEWPCPHCGSITDIYVEIESPSDYYADKNCEHCDKEIDDPILDNKIMEEAAEYLVSRAEWYRD